MRQLQQSQLFRYIITGGMTTAVNYILFFLMTTGTMNYLIANSAAWLGAVIFAYFTNRKVVFHSGGDKLQEFARFASLRLATLLVENVLLFLMVDAMAFSQLVSKVLVSIITVALNYLACKYSVFKEGGVSHE